VAGTNACALSKELWELVLSIDGDGTASAVHAAAQAVTVQLAQACGLTGSSALTDLHAAPLMASLAKVRHMRRC
jgi:hypothetical protein